MLTVGALGALTLFASCGSDDEEIITNPEDEFDVELTFSDGTASIAEPVVELYGSSTGQTTFKARVTITATKTIRRVYVTTNVAGTGDEPFDLRDFGLSNKATKPDGSIDVESTGDQNTVDYTLNLPIPSGIGTNGTIVYSFWATNGKGDYRDPSNSLAAGVGQIEVTVGTGANPAAPVKSYSAKVFAAPLADGSSETFISLLDGQLYRIDEGAEFSRLWDFGYYYGNTLKASLAAAGNYPTSIIDVATVANTTDADLNSCFFQLSTKTTAEFDAIAVSGDLSFVTSSGNERINGLAVGDVVEFVDNYGKKGLIKVTEIVGTFNSGDYIKIDIKVQP